MPWVIEHFHTVTEQGTEIQTATVDIQREKPVYTQRRADTKDSCHDNVIYPQQYYKVFKLHRLNAAYC